MSREVHSDNMVDSYFTKFDYDDQGRITEIEELDSADQLINQHKFTYKGNELIHYEDYWSEMDIKKEGNTIHASYGDDNYIITLNNDSAITKQETKGEHGSTRSDFQYLNGNLVKQTKTSSDSFGSSEVVITYLLDDKKSPFLHCKSPNWIIQSRLGDSGLINNVTEANTMVDNERFDTISYIYVYDNDGYPIKRTEIRKDKELNESKTITTYGYDIKH